MRNPAAARSPTAAVARWWPGVYKILIFCPAMSALLLRRAFLYLGVISARDRATAPVHCSGAAQTTPAEDSTERHHKSRNSRSSNRSRYGN